MRRRRQHPWRGYTAAVALAVTASACTSAPGEQPELATGPDRVLIDEPAEFSASGLTPGTEATLWVRTTDGQGRLWAAWGVFAADAEGRVDPAVQAPESGSYDGVHPEGLLWSMRVSDGESPNGTAPVSDGDTELDLTVGVDVGGHTLAEEDTVRLLHDPGIRTERLDGTAGDLVGDLYLPPDSGPHPGVLLLSGSEGGRAQPQLAELMASRGLAVLSLAYFAEAGVPDSLESIPVEYGQDALGFLADHEDVAGDRVGVIGASKGGEFALLLASADPRVGAAVSVVGSGAAMFGIPSPTATEPEGGGSWSRGGEDLPYLELSPNPPEGALGALRGHPTPLDWSYAGALEQASPAELEAATFPVEELDGPLLLVTGAQDQLWPPDLTGLAEDRRAEHGDPDGTELVDHPEAGHALLGVPNLPTTYSGAAPLVPDFLWMELGGDPRANAEAVDDTFHRSVDLFHDALGEAL